MNVLLLVISAGMILVFQWNFDFCSFLGQFHGAIAVPSVTRCRCVVVIVVVDIDAQASCDSGGSSDTW